MSPIRMSRLEAGIHVVLEFTEACNRHDVKAMMQLISDDCIVENTDPAPDGARFLGKEAVTRFWEEFFRNSPDAHIEIEEIFSLGPRCIMRWRYDWVDAGGKKEYLRGVHLFQVKNGSIWEILSYAKR
jgi:limonene-1,2-epoxide hydrolase